RLAVTGRGRWERFRKRSRETWEPVSPRSMTAKRLQPTALSGVSSRGPSRRDPPTMQPCLMARVRVSTRHFVDGHPVVDVVPVIRGRVGGVDAERLDGVDNLQYAFDLGPA